MASENIMMKAVKKGGDRQELHERLREHAVAAAAVVKQEGKPNDMIARVEADPAFGLTREEIEAELSPEDFTGRARSRWKSSWPKLSVPCWTPTKRILASMWS